MCVCVCIKYCSTLSNISLVCNVTRKEVIYYEKKKKDLITES